MISTIKLYEFRINALSQKLIDFKRILSQPKPYDFYNEVKRGRTLFVGEGNLSFSECITRKYDKRMKIIISSTFEVEEKYDALATENARKMKERGIFVVGGVDATRLSDRFESKIFDNIIFQFPNVGSRKPKHGRNPNHILVRRFLRSASRHISIRGSIIITVVNSSHYDGAFDMDGAADFADLQRPESYPFFLSDFPSYQHCKTHDDGTSAIQQDDELVTYVFKSKYARA